MNTFNFLPLVFLLSIVNSITYAQGDYVITKNHEKVFCELRTESYGEYNPAYEYRVSKKSHFAKLDSIIVAYHIANDSAIYQLKNVPTFKSKIYLKRFVSGRINLYAYANTSRLYQSSGYNEVGNTYLFASKGEDDVVQIKHASATLFGNAHSQNEEKAAFLGLVADNPAILEKLETVKYDFYYILKYVKIYNSEYKENNKPVK